MGRSVDWQSFVLVKFNWTIVQFNLRLSGFTKAYKAALAWTIKLEKGGRSSCFGSLMAATMGGG